ncbi:hypothetical protein [Limnobacter sp.]|uniref:hypothetical protein n=1 Tax=Limnobacter sp. TaxID=2003368 RepID=UPI002586B0CB|nr:hypothetical protein [Limnobacter sp.]
MHSQLSQHAYFDWLESVEDGSLTLQAERFLFVVPGEIVPSFTTLFTPDLINIAVGSLNVDLSNPHETHWQALADRVATIVRNEDCYGVSEPIQIQRIQSELQTLEDWLRKQANLTRLSVEVGHVGAGAVKSAA